MTHFTKQPNGSWRFETRRGETYEAWRNEAGFAGRQWTLSRIDWYGVADGRYNEMTTVIRDDIESRKACVAEAEWLGRSADEFWAHINFAVLNEEGN